MKIRSNIRYMVQGSFLAALSIVLTRTLSIMVTPTLRLGLGEIPLIISGIIFGPAIGGATGFVSDMIGFVINPQGKFHLGFTISSILWGMLSGILANLLRGKKDYRDNLSFSKLLILIGVVRLVIAVILNTYWLSQLYGSLYVVLLSERIIFSFIQVPIEAYIINKVLTYVSPVLKLE